MHAISSYRGNRPTTSATDRGDYNTLRRSLARSVINIDENNLRRGGKQLSEYMNPR